MTGAVGFVDGRPVPRAELDRRLASLRHGPRSSALPSPGSAEERQLTRWLAQVILTEELCSAEAAVRGLPTASSPPVPLDQRAAVELGSIAAAAFSGSAAVRAVYEDVTADVTVSPQEAAAYAARARPPDTGPCWLIRMGGHEFEARPDSLPECLATALRTAPAGHAVTAGRWTATLVGVVDAHDDGPGPVEHLRSAARRLAFVRWLEHARAHRVALVAGLEHPGDPRQPDNHHRH